MPIDSSGLTVHLEVQPDEASPKSYRMLIRNGESTQELGKCHFDAHERISSFDPYHLGVPRNPIIESARCLEVRLPADPVVVVDWERVCSGRVLRRMQQSKEPERKPLRLPLRCGFVSTTRQLLKQLGDPKKMMEAVAGLAPDILDLKMAALPTLNKLRRFIREYPLDILHLVLAIDPALDQSFAVFGDEQVQLQSVINELSRSGVRMAVLHDISSAPRPAMSALRLAAHKQPSNSETAFALCSNRDFNIHSYEPFYARILADEPVDVSLRVLESGSEVPPCVLAPNRVSRALGIQDAIKLTGLKNERIRIDLSNFALPGNAPSRTGHKSTSFTKGNTLEANIEPLSKLKEAIVEAAEVKKALDEVMEERKDEPKPDQPRYPIASFYYVADGIDTPIPTNKCVSAPPPGQSLEFHFWIDPEKGGIASVSERPHITPPEHTAYPITFQVKVWSDDFQFQAHTQDLVLDAVGATKHARFPIVHLTDPREDAELFVFLQYQGTLIAAYRVLADVAEQIGVSGKQSLAYAYVATDWFRFASLPTTSALTIFVTKKHGQLQIFTLNREAQPWARLGPDEKNLYQTNIDMYLEVQRLSRLAEAASERHEEFNSSKEAQKLAQYGWSLFTGIFEGSPQQSDQYSLNALVDDYIAKLEPGAAISIAIGDEAQNLWVPWGLLYDRKPPTGVFGSVPRDGFWGQRFNLSIRPAYAPRNAKPEVTRPVQMGAVWLSHEETSLLRTELERFKEVNITPIRALDNSVPDLAIQKFDLIEFFCHGHTKSPDVFSQEQTADFIKEYVAADHLGQSRLLMTVEPTTDSLIEIDGGRVPLSNLRHDLRSGFPGQPIILLSMCESAQVTSSGSGFVPLFLSRGARAVIGTEGPALWSMSREMDTAIIRRMIEEKLPIGRAFYETKKEQSEKNILALIYTLYGDPDAKLG